MVLWDSSESAVCLSLPALFDVDVGFVALELVFQSMDLMNYLEQWAATSGCSSS